jgi:electron transfer flavoprotein alpha subunit
MSVATRTLLSRYSTRGRVPSLLHDRFQLGHRLQSTLAILEQRNGKLVNGTLSTFAAAKALGGPVHGFVAGASVSGPAQEASKVEGVEKVITVENDAYEKVRQDLRLMCSRKQILHVNSYAHAVPGLA